MPRDAYTPTIDDHARALAGDFGAQIDAFADRAWPSTWVCGPNDFTRRKRRQMRAAVAQWLVSDGDECLRDVIEAFRSADDALERSADDSGAADDADDAIMEFTRVAEDVAQQLAGEICRKESA